MSFASTWTLCCEWLNITTNKTLHVTVGHFGCHPPKPPPAASTAIDNSSASFIHRVCFLCTLNFGTKWSRSVLGGNILIRWTWCCHEKRWHDIHIVSWSPRTTQLLQKPWLDLKHYVAMVTMCVLCQCFFFSSLADVMKHIHTHTLPQLCSTTSIMMLFSWSAFTKQWDLPMLNSFYTSWSYGSIRMWLLPNPSPDQVSMTLRSLQYGQHINQNQALCMSINK